MGNYIGHKSSDGKCRVHYWEDGSLDPVPIRLDLWSHSPDGFQWGYQGSGPSQLALAILAHATGCDDIAIRLHQHFKWDQIAHIKAAQWVLPRERVLTWVVCKLSDIIADTVDLTLDVEKNGDGEPA